MSKLIPVEIKQSIIRLHSEGLLSKDIAKQLNIPVSSVSYYLNTQNLKSNWSSIRPHMDMITDTTARCSKCRDIKDINQFQFQRAGKSDAYRLTYCRLCRITQCQSLLNNNITKLLEDKYCRLRIRAKKSNIIFDISKEEFIQQYHDQNGKCFYTDVDMIMEVGKGHHRDTLSIDKIIPENGYTSKNVVFCRYKINAAKSDLTLEEIREWMPKWYEKIRNFLKIA